MMVVQRQKGDGSWGPARPLPEPRLWKYVRFIRRMLWRMG
jgi:hypothetical protein